MEDTTRQRSRVAHNLQLSTTGGCHPLLFTAGANMQLLEPRRQPLTVHTAALSRVIKANETRTPLSRSNRTRVTSAHSTEIKNARKLHRLYSCAGPFKLASSRADDNALWVWKARLPIMMTTVKMSYAVLTYEIIIFQNYSSLRRRPSEIILFQRVKTCRNYFKIISK